MNWIRHLIATLFVLMAASFVVGPAAAHVGTHHHHRGHTTIVSSCGSTCDVHRAALNKASPRGAADRCGDDGGCGCECCSPAAAAPGDAFYMPTLVSVTTRRPFALRFTSRLGIAPALDDRPPRLA